MRDHPDPDAIKMFVGQMPRHMDENDIRAMFEEYGPVHQINVLRDKLTGQSKGQWLVWAEGPDLKEGENRRTGGSKMRQSLAKNVS